jgi:hypothetical protein
MKTEDLIAKGVEKHFTGQEVLFKVNSLKEHYDGLLIHDTDVIELLQSVPDSEVDFISVKFVKLGDVNFENAVEIGIAPQVESEDVIAMTYKEAELLLVLGKFIALPEWAGFWFLDLNSSKILVLTKEGEILNTPWEICKERNDWIEVEANEEQLEVLRIHYDPETEVAED